MAKAIMIQGTGSGVGKSAIVAGLCRIFRNLGIKVAPFKSQNMALNSFITKEGGEIGRAQAFQAEAAGIEPCNDINPVLLKATSDQSCQVMLDGKVYGNLHAGDYYAMKEAAWDVVRQSYDRLASQYDLIVLEGAGSPAEINLREDEIVNMRMARHAASPVILAGDIDKGGVFASFFGTIGLLSDAAEDCGASGQTDADFIKAFIVNKFRGDRGILRPGLRMIEDRTGRPVIGVIDYLGDLGIHEEDAIPAERLVPGYSRRQEQLKVVVPVLKYISNFTDFDPFLHEQDIALKYSNADSDIRSADMIIIPGSKNTVSDLLFLRESGIERSIQEAVRAGTPLVGICGGYQMLGAKIFDPLAVESSMREVDGMGLLDVATTLDTVKTTSQVSASVIHSGWFDAVPGESSCRWNSLKGYEIHMGHTTGDVGLFRLNRVASDAKLTTHNALSVPDGSVKGNVWGTYIHGIFDNDGIRTAVINSLRKRKGMPLRTERVDYRAMKEAALDRWADTLQQSVDVCFLLRLVGMEACAERMK